MYGIREMALLLTHLDKASSKNACLLESLEKSCLAVAILLDITQR
jgi:hypothetical protein